MSIRVAINGFGRIGRLCLRALIESGRDDVEVVAINDLGPVESNAHLLKYDSVHGVLPADVSSTEKAIVVNDKVITCLAERDPANLPWADLEVDIVYECTGIFVAKDQAQKHIDAGAKKVLISAPGKEVDLTVVYGVNDHVLTNDHKIVSNASCTTNCLAPVADVLHQAIGIEKGYMTTVHSYTGDQRTVDTLHSDPRRARAASLSLIPTSTGAAKAVGLVLPELLGKLDGSAIRVPTPNVSMVDLTFTASRNTSIEEINELIKEAANGRLNGILGAYDAPLVSIDFNHNAHSSAFDLTQTTVMEGNFVRILSWYDNEWGFSNRMSDTAVAMAKTGL
ncbi:type I glyceraldehyde-3-phosphate dehydrogenase [Terasakiella sp. A23]|uniref:type I glyceraldehyde-3-phosphate dehydrogenase n=1 Tax=Terasakiella sp. FCG-A23 TaxID=3080561 RepID=UPI0029548428|nr:type I glyceraldehyde-3-phosphate dehydrogenase [Terasakiella sp. A23]MDV7341765.1 type I glyceraldehyde-3-phosphate dehydrogenase [Terasakiella sp. A23]